MEAFGYFFYLCLALSLVLTVVGLALSKKLHFRFGIILTCTFAGLLALWPPREKLKLGIDLSGGTILVYEVVKENLPANFNMDELISALKHRVDPQGVKEIPIRKIGGNRLEIILPADEDVDEVKRMLTDVGALEFRILATYKHTSDADVKRALGPTGRSKPPPRYMWARLGEVSTGTNPTTTTTTITDPAQDWKKNHYAGINVELTGKDASGAEQVVVVPIVRNTTDTLVLARPHDLSKVTSYRVEYNPSEIGRGVDPKNPRPNDPIIREDKVAPGRVERSILTNSDREDVTGKYLPRVYATQDERLQPAVGFVFNRQGARKFGKLTREHLPEEGDAFKYQLAILLDNLVMSAPSINSEIRDQGIIEGGGQGFKAKEVDYLIKILQEGSLPASLNPNPLQEERVGPTLGEDTIAKGVRAIWVSMLVVPIFMVIYYRFAGVVAVVALLLNMILLIGTMAFMQSTFSLPGLAGLALTIGMAVDANVLVFERMREEKERGASLVHQIRNGFNRAWVTIFDSHVTQLLSSLVFWWVGTEEVKGFALTMIIGMLWNLFTAVFVSRVIFELFYVKGWLKKLTMMKLMSKTNIDFIGPRYYCIAGSLIVIALGLGATCAAGPDDVQHRLHRRHAGHDPAQRAGPRRQGAERVAAGQLRPAEGQRPPRRHGREPDGRPGPAAEPLQHPDDRPGPRARQGDHLEGVRPEPGARHADPRRGQADHHRGDAGVRRARRGLGREPLPRRPAIRAEVQHADVQQHAGPRSGRRGHLRQRRSGQGEDRQPDRAVRDRESAPGRAAERP